MIPPNLDDILDPNPLRAEPNPPAPLIAPKAELAPNPPRAPKIPPLRPFPEANPPIPPIKAADNPPVKGAAITPAKGAIFLNNLLLTIFFTGFTTAFTSFFKKNSGNPVAGLIPIELPTI